MIKDTVLTPLFKQKENYTHFSDSFTVSALHILKKQADLLKVNETKDQKGNIYDWVFDYYRLSVMNSRYGPQRLPFTMQPPLYFEMNYLTLLSQNEF